MVEIIHAGGGDLVCCGQPMSLLHENSTDAAQEKHVPVIESSDGSVRVRVGSVPHPMEEKHFIEWLEIIAGNRICRRFLKPGEAPSAEFILEAGSMTVREFCNLHGLWKAQK